MNGSCSPRRATEHARGAFTRMWFHGDSSVLRLLVTRGMSSVRSMELGSVTFKRIGFFVFQFNTRLGTLNTHTPNFWDSIVRYKTETGGFGLNKLYS